MKVDPRWLLLLAFSTIGFLINVDYSAVNLALIPMTNHWHTDLNTIQWALSGYLLGWAMLVIPGGKYADVIDKRFLYLLGLGLFLAASLLAGLASSPAMLIFARVLQGMAGGMYVPTVYALIAVVFVEKERGRAMGLLSLGIGLGMALGPFIGGVLLSLLSWRSIFFINIPIGFVAWWIVYSNDHLQTTIAAHKVSLDKFSMILFSASIAMTIYLLSLWQSWSQHNVSALLWLSGIFIIVGFLIAIQRRSQNPLFPATLFVNRLFLGCIFGILGEQFGFSAIMVTTSLYLQKVLQYSAFKSSLMFLFLSMIFGVVAVAGGSWVDRIGLKKPTLIGLAIMALGSFLFSQLSPFSSLGWVSVIFFILGGGMGLAFAGLNTGILKTVDSESIGMASSIFLVFALMGNAFGVTLTTMIYEAASLTAFLKVLPQTILDPGQIQQLATYIAKIGEKTPDFSLFSPALHTTILAVTQTALNFGTNYTMLINCLISVLAFIVCALLWLQPSPEASPSIETTN